MTDQLARFGTTALAAIPEHLRDQIGNRAGMEDVGREDVLIPRLCIAQALSPQLKKTNENYIKGLEVGAFFNSVTGRIYGEKVTVVPLFFFKQFIEFKDINAGGGIVSMYHHAEDIPADKTYRLDQVPQGEKPQVTEFKNEMCLIVTEDGGLEPIVVSFKSTGMKTAKKWNSLMRAIPLPSYAKFYDLLSVTQTKGQQEWAGANVIPGEFVPAALFQAAETFFKQLRESGVKVDTTGLGGDEPNPDADDPNAPAAF